MNKVFIVILNWNKPKLTIDCVQSVLKSRVQGVECKIVIVDNGSTDPIEKYIRDYIKPKKLNFIRFEENIGLMETNKLAYETCTTDLLMLLHTDCYIFEKIKINYN